MVLGYAKIHEGDSERLNFPKLNETNLAQLHVHTRGAERKDIYPRTHSKVEPKGAKSPGEAR